MVSGHGHSIVELMARHSKVSIVLDSSEVDTDKRLVVVGEKFLQSSARALVRRADGRPILFSYGADGTPLVARRIHMQRLSAETGSSIWG